MASVQGEIPNQYSDLVTHLESILTPVHRLSLASSVIPTLVHCVNLVSESLRSSQRITFAGTANTFGDDQLNVDVLAEQIIRAEIAKCPTIWTASSEEDPSERAANDRDGGSDTADSERYTIAFDPLDGSSIIASNWTVGTIMGVWDGVSALHEIPAERQIAAVLGVYGPRTTAIIAIRISGAPPTCFEVGFAQNGNAARCEVLRSSIGMSAPPFKTRYFAPANLRAAAEDQKYMQLITSYIKQKYTLRYSGGLVPDVVHMLTKGHGIYTSPVTATSKAKLRRLYELAPIALIMECAGASAVDPTTGERILARPIEDCDERAGLVCGSSDEVLYVTQTLDSQP